MAEWSNATVLKTVVPERVPGVRIPLSPPSLAETASYGGQVRQWFAAKERFAYVLCLHISMF